MVEIDCAGERLQLLPEKAVFWPATKTLIIADVHLGKPAAFRMAGIAVPETTTDADLHRLEFLVRTYDCRRVVILGDLLHAPAGMQPAMTDSVDRWRSKHPALEILLVPGNHDRKCGSPPSSWNLSCVDAEWQCGPFLFSHEPMERPNAYVMCGHVHPALVLHDKFGPSVRAACFCFGKQRAILPAFGSFTGMSPIKLARGERIFAVGAGEVIEVK